MDPLLDNDTSEPPKKKIKLSDQELLKDILQFMECPICLMPLISNIWNCSNGHPICYTCRKKIKKCPTCRSSPLTKATCLERFASVVDSCKLFKCPYQNCGILFTKSEMKVHLKKCQYVPLYYPLDFQKSYNDIKTYLLFLRNNGFKTIDELHFTENISDSFIITSDDTVINTRYNYNANRNIKYVFHFPNEKMLIYLIGVSNEFGFEYGLYYQKTLNMNVDENVNEIEITSKLSISVSPEDIKDNESFKKMTIHSITLENNAINILDIIGLFNDGIENEKDFESNDILASHTYKIDMGFYIMQSIYYISKNLNINVVFNMNNKKLVEIDNADT
jgi:hypothetical protein